MIVAMALFFRHDLLTLSSSDEPDCRALMSLKSLEAAKGDSMQAYISYASKIDARKRLKFAYIVKQCAFCDAPGKTGGGR